MVAIEEATAACLIYGDDRSQIISLLNTSTNNSIRIDNKYFTVSIKIIELGSASADPVTSLPVNAVIVHGSFETLEAVSTKSSFSDSDVKLYVASERPNPDNFQFCIDNQVEFVDVEEEPERILEALSSSIWPGAKMKNSETRNPTASSGALAATRMNDVIEGGIVLDELDHLAGLEDDDEYDYGAMLSLLSRVRGQGQNLSDGERRANAEQMISAIYNMLGNESEPDTDSD